MIPTVLLVGFGVAVARSGRMSWWHVALVGVAVSLLWGAMVGVADGRLVTFVGGSGLAAVNVSAGAFLGALVRRLSRDSASG